jgi:hypothetical protein
MKKIIVTLAVLLLAAPAMASVDITCTVSGPNEVTIAFSTTGEAELVRAIALDVQVDDPNAWIEDVNCVSAGYYIYPGSINIDAAGEVVDYGSCAGVQDGNAMTSEQGSLYVGAANEPAEGDLFIVTLGGCTLDASGDVDVTVSENALRGGVVMEDPALSPTVNLPGATTVNIGQCATTTCPCAGDIDGDLAVSFNDLIAMYSEMVVQYPTGDPSFVYNIGMPSGMECADLDGDTVITFNDLITMYSEMVVQYPTGDPSFVYNIGCPF